MLWLLISIVLIRAICDIPTTGFQGRYGDLWRRGTPPSVCSDLDLFHVASDAVTFKSLKHFHDNDLVHSKPGEGSAHSSAPPGRRPVHDANANAA